MASCKKNIPIYKQAPVTASTADFLAKVYGSPNIAEYAASLPRSAKVLDVGAGNSELGRVIASTRPDIAWTNLDINYTTSELRQLNRSAPKNLVYLYGNILDTDKLPKQKFDIVYAFWVLPHIGLENPKLIKVGIVNMVQLLKSGKDSRLRIGPLMSKRSRNKSTHYLTSELSKNSSANQLDKTVRECTPPKSQIAQLRAMNRAGLTTLKNDQRSGQKPTKLGLWDFKNRQYVKAFTPRGLFLLTRFRMYLVIEKMKAQSS